MDNTFISNYIIMPDGNIINKKTHKTLKPFITKSGYHQVTLYDFQGNHKKFLVHRLVAIAHLPNPDNLPQVNHINLNRSDNRASNLEWCSALQNIRHARENGRNIYTTERNAKISKAKKGIPRPATVIEKMRQTMLKNGTNKGKKNGMYGKHLTPEQIQKRTHSCFHKNKSVEGCPFCAI